MGYEWFFVLPATLNDVVESDVLPPTVSYGNTAVSWTHYNTKICLKRFSTVNSLNC